MVHKPLALVTAFLLLVGIISMAGAPTAHAAAWTADTAGVDTVRAGKATNPASRGDVLAPSTTTPTIPVPAIDPNGLYSIDDGSWATVYKLSTSTGTSTGLFRVHGSANTYNSTMAVDSGVNGRRPGFYTWYWGNADGYEGAPATTMPVYFWEVGKNNASDIYYVPRPRYFSHNIGNAYYSGGVLNQKTGMLYMSPGECDSIGGTARFQIVDPATLTTYWSGPVQPATPSDDLWNGRANSCGYAGYISSGAAILPNGDFVVIVNGTGKALTASDPVNTTGKAIAAGTTANVSFMVSVHPSMNNQPWTYSVMKMITSPPSGNVGNFFGTHHWGTAFSNGYLYVVTNGYLHEVNPLTGYIKQVGTTGSTMFDLGSSQTAAAITGRVLNDADASGDYDANDAGVEGVTIAIYQSGGRNNYAQPTLLGTTTTSGNGQYTFIVPDSDPAGNAKYYVRMVQPSIDGVAAVNTAGAVISDTQAGASNDAQLTCVDGNIYVGDAAGSTVGGTCSNVRADGTTSGTALETLGAVGDPATWGPYGTVVMRNTWSESTIDFTISTGNTSYGDAAAGPNDATAPVHNNSSGATLWLGDAQGSNTLAMDNAAHNSTDDGVYIDSYVGKVPLQDTILAASKTYTLATDIAGSLAGSAKVTGWVTGAGNNNWNTVAKWTPTITNSVARGDFQFQTGPISGSPTVQMRVNASTVVASGPTNNNSEYQGSATTWTTPGEIEDYSFTVQDSVYRPAAVTTGPTGTFTIGGKAITAAANPVVGPAVGAAATQPVTLTASAPNNSWTLVEVQVKDTVTGAVKYTPTPATTGLNSTVTWTPALGDDVTVEFKYTKAPDPAKSSLTVDRNQAPVGEYITATAEVLDSDGNQLPGVEVTFANQSAPTTTLSASKCTTGPDGKCQVTITSNTAGTYPAELSATVTVYSQVLHVAGSPRDLAFVADKPDPAKSSLSFTPPGPLTVGDQAASTYTFAALILDSNNNRVPGQIVSWALTRDDGTPINPAATHLSNNTCTTGDGSGTTTAGVCTVTLWSLDAGTYKVQAKITDPVTGLPTELGSGSPASVTFNPAPPAPGPFTCDDGQGGRKPGSSISARPDTLPVGDNSDITAYVTDQYCNPIPGAAVVFAIHPSSTAILTTPSASTGPDGKAYSTLTDSTAETVNVNATASVNNNPGVAVDTPKPVRFEVGGFSWTTSTFTVSPVVSATDPARTGWPEANGNDAYTLTLTARDSQNNLLTGLDTTKMAITPSSTNVMVSAVQEMSAGVYQVTLTSQTASTTPTVSVSYNNQSVKNPSGGTASPIPFKPGPVDPTPGTCVDGRSRSYLSVSPTDVPVSASANVEAYVTDANCNPIDAELVWFTVDGSATIAPASKLTGPNGIAPASVTDNVAETVSVVAKVQVNGVATTLGTPQQVRFSAGTPDPAKSHVTVAPSTQKAGSPVIVTVTVRDSNDNPIRNLTTADIQMTGTTSGSPDLVFTDFAPHPDGTYTFKTTSQQMGIFTVRATVQSVLVDDAPTVEFTAGDICVTGCSNDPDRQTRIRMTVNDQLADGVAKDRARAYAFDAYGNPVAGAVFTLTASSQSGALAPAIQTVTTGVDGTTMVEWFSLTAGDYAVLTTVLSGSMQTSVDVGNSDLNSIRFTAGLVSAAKSSLTISPTTAQMVGSSFTATAKVTDANGNPLAGETVTFNLSSPKVSLSAQTCQTLSSGICSVVVSSKLVGDYQVSATVNQAGQPTAISGSPQTVSFFASSTVCVDGVDVCTPVDDPTTPEDESVTHRTHAVVNPDNAVADGVDRDTIVVHAYDNYGNPVKQAAVQVRTTDAMLTLLMLDQPTDNQGTARFDATSTVAGGHLAQVTVDGKTPPGSPTTLNFTTGAISNISLSISPASALAAGSNFTVTAHVADSTGNGLDKAVVSFALPAGLTTPAGQAVTSCTTVAGDCAIQVTSTKAGTYPVTGRVNSTVSNVVSAQFTAGVVSATHSFVTVSHDGEAFDGLAHDIVTVRALDQYGNPVAGVAVSSTAVAGQSSGLAVQPTITPTGPDGTTTIWYSSTQAGAKRADVRLNGTLVPQGSPVTISFGNGTGDPDHSTWTLSPATPLTVGSGAGSQFTAEVTVRDAFDTPVVGAVVSFGADRDGTSWGKAKQSCVTDAQGWCAVTLTSTKAGTFGITAALSSGAIGQAKSAVWVPDAVCGVCSTAQVTTDNAVADGNDVDLVTVTARDQYDNPVPGQLVTSTAGDADLRVGTGIPFTDANGLTVIKYSSLKAGPHTATVAIGAAGLAPTGSPLTVKFQAGAGQAGPFTCTNGQGGTIPGTNLSVFPASLEVGNSAQATALVTDKQCNPVPGVPVTFAATGSGSVAPVTVVTGPDGKAMAQVGDLVAETVDVTAYFPLNGVATKVDDPKPVTFTASTPTVNPTQCPPGKIGTNLSVAPADVAIPGRAAATAYVTDDYCNPVGAVSVSFSVTGNAQMPSPVLTDAAGLAVAQVADLTPETVYVTAQLGSAAIPGSPARVRFLDTTAPGAPVITSPSGGSLSNDDPLIIAGTGEPGAVVAVKDFDGSVACQAQVGSGGTWTCSVSLADGDHTLTATQTDPSGNQSAPSTPVKVTVDTIAPTVVITGADKFTIVGTSEPGATITLSYPKSDGSRGTVNVPVKADGSWSVPTPVTAVSGVIEAVATDAAGNQSSKDSKYIDLDAPGAPTINQANEQGISGVGDPATTQPGDSVLVKDSGGAVICSTTVQPDLSWSCTLPSPTVKGEHDGPITAVIIDPSGNVSAPGTGILDTQAPPAPKVDHPLSGQSINDTTPTVSGSGEAGATVTVNTPGGGQLCTAVVRPDGTWSCTVANPLPEGSASLVVAQTDPAGNTSNPTVVTVVVDTVAPGTPVVDVANSTQISGTLPGPIDPGTIVTITDQAGNDVCVATVGSDGKWLCLTPGSIGGDTVITVVATDPAGNASGPVNVLLDVTPPGQPTIDSANGTQVTGTVPGNVDPGTTIIITFPDGSTSVVPVNPDGTWQVATPPNVGSGTITVVAKDPSGNVSAEVTAHLDTDPPTSPVVNPSNGSEVSGTAEPGGTVTVLDGTGTPVPGCQQVSVNTSGGFSCQPTKPLHPGETIQVVVRDKAGNPSAPTVVTIGQLGITVAYPTLYPQETQVVTGTSFNAGEQVCLLVHPTSLNVGCAKADGQGKVTISFPVPGTLTPGSHEVELKGDQSGSVKSAFTVSVRVPSGGTVVPQGTTVLPGPPSREGGPVKSK